MLLSLPFVENSPFGIVDSTDSDTSSSPLSLEDYRDMDIMASPFALQQQQQQLQQQTQQQQMNQVQEKNKKNSEEQSAAPKKKRIRKTRAKVKSPELIQKLKTTRRQRANDRERNRMHGLNEALEVLRTTLPNSTEAKMTKIETLRYACNYINALASSVKLTENKDRDGGFSNNGELPNPEDYAFMFNFQYSNSEDHCNQDFEFGHSPSPHPSSSPVIQAMPSSSSLLSSLAARGNQRENSCFDQLNQLSIQHQRSQQEHQQFFHQNNALLAQHQRFNACNPQNNADLTNNIAQRPHNMNPIDNFLFPHVENSSGFSQHDTENKLNAQFQLMNRLHGGFLPHHGTINTTTTPTTSSPVPGRIPQRHPQSSSPSTQSPSPFQCLIDNQTPNEPAHDPAYDILQSFNASCGSFLDNPAFSGSNISPMSTTNSSPSSISSCSSPSTSPIHNTKTISSTIFNPSQSPNNTLPIQSPAEFTHLQKQRPFQQQFNQPQINNHLRLDEQYHHNPTSPIQQHNLFHRMSTPVRPSTFV